MKNSKNKMLIQTLAIFVFVFFVSTSFQKHVNADIAVSGNTYTITSGQDLFNLLTNSNSYWNSNNQPPQNMNIVVAKDITLPGGLPQLYNGIKNANVNFQSHAFYVSDQGASSIWIPKTSSANLTISNLSVGSNTTTNSATGVPNISGTATTNAFYTSYFGILFSSDYGASLGTSSVSSQITYNNVDYYFPNNISYNQPLCSYYIPINFTGENSITTSNSSQQLGEISNIKVSSGTTSIKGGTNGTSFSGAMIYPYYNNTFNKSFPVDVASGATLNLENQSASNMFAFTGTNNSVVINNQGNLNLISTQSSTTFFGSGTLGVSLNCSSGSNTNFNAAGNVLNTQMSTRKFVANLDAGSNTLLTSSTSSVLKNNTSWTNNSSINVNSGAKLVAYSGGATSGGLTDSSSNSIPFTFNSGGSTAKGYNNVSKPDNINSYDMIAANDYRYNKDGSTIVSSNLNASSDKALVISSELSLLYPKSDSYSWIYSLGDLPSTKELLPRTSPKDMQFVISDTKDESPSFSVSASYHANDVEQPFSIYFKNNERSVQLSDQNQKVFSEKDMTNTNTLFKQLFDSSSGLLMQADNRVKSGTYSGIIDWTLSGGL